MSTQDIKKFERSSQPSDDNSSDCCEGTQDTTPEIGLDFSHDNMAREDFRSKFDSIAKTLLDAFNLVIAGKIFRLAEIEFYYHGGEHTDEFAHQSELQLNSCGEWYFHRAGSKPDSKYKGGSYKGLDVTFGRIGQAHGGILIRSIYSPSSQELVEGPCRVVDRILKENEMESIVDLVTDLNSLDVFDSLNKRKLFLQQDSSSSSLSLSSSSSSSSEGFIPKFIASPRVGLTLKRSPLEKEWFIMQPYRYIPRFIAPDCKKYKPLMMIALHQSSQHVSIDSVATLYCTSSQKVQNYLDMAAPSSSITMRSFHGKKLNTGALCKLYGTWLNLYGQSPAYTEHEDQDSSNHSDDDDNDDDDEQQQNRSRKRIKLQR